MTEEGFAGLPEGSTIAARFDGGQVVRTPTEIVVIAVVRRDDDELAHNCDAMGCGADHVVFRESIPPPLPDHLQLNMAKVKSTIDDLVAERDALIAANGELEDAAGAEHDDQEAAIAELAAENKLLRDHRDRLQAADDMDHRGVLVDELRAEVARLRPVVEASEAYHHGNGTVGGVLDALDTYRTRLVQLPRADLFEEIVETDAHLQQLMKERVAEVTDDESRCAVCGWPVAPVQDDGCVRGNCSMRPRPETLYAPERAAKEADRG